MSAKKARTSSARALGRSMAAKWPPGLEWLAFRLTALGCEFRLHDSPELAGYLRDLAARAAPAAGQPAPARVRIRRRRRT